MKRQTIPIRLITRDHRFQARVKLDMKLVNEYVRLYQERADLPPLEVMDIDGTGVLIDGFHRILALDVMKAEMADVTLTSGTEADAYKRAAIVNAEHGQRRGPKDIKVAIELAFRYFLALPAPVFDRLYRHRTVPNPKADMSLEIDGWTNQDVATLVGVSLSVINAHRETVLNDLPEATSLRELESGYLARRRQATADGIERAKVNRARHAAATTETAPPETVAQVEAERESEREDLESRLEDEDYDEPPIPFLHDNWIGQDLMRGGVKMMDGIGVWKALEKEYGEVRLRQYVLQSAQLQDDLRLWLRAIERTQLAVERMLAGVEEVAHA